MIEEQLAAGRTAPAGPPRPRGASGAPPPRPPVTSGLPFPGTRAPARRARAPRLGVGLWGAGLAAWVIAVVCSVLDADSIRAGLLDSARRADPGRSAGVLDRGVAVTVLAVASANALLLLVCLAALVLLVRGRRRARWVLLVSGLLWLPVIAVDQSVVAGGRTDVDRWALLVQGGLVVLAVVALLFPRRSPRR